METDSIDVEHPPRKQGFTPLKAFLKRSERIPKPKMTKSSRISTDQRRKRVKFAGSTSICEPEGGPDSPLLENKVDGAKTSEYKAFKGLLENFVYRDNCDEIAISKINQKTGKDRDCLECLSNAITSGSDVNRSMSPMQIVSSVVQGSESLSAQIAHKCESKNKGKGKIGATRSVQFSMNTPTAPPLHHSPLKIRESCGEHSGTRHEHEGTFSGKRANLLHLAAMTCTQNVDDFFSKRSDFIIEIFQRLGIRRKSSEGQDEKYLSSVCDMTKFQAFPYNHVPDTSSKCKLKSNLVLNENGASLLHDFSKSVSAFDLCENFNRNKYVYNCLDWTLYKAYALSSPFEFDEVKARPTDYSAYMGHQNKCLHINSTSDHNELYEFCFTNKSDPTVNRKAELDYGSIYESYQADCIIPYSYNSNINFQEQALVPCINEVQAYIWSLLKTN